MARIAIIDDS